MSDGASDDEDLVLSGSTLAALQEFMKEKDAREKRFEELKAQAESDSQNRTTINAGHIDVSMTDFEPDWNVSQFWYDEETSRALAEELLTGATEETVVGLVSAPSVFVKLTKLMKESVVPKCQIHLFEYDTRFDIFKEQFQFYDFNTPIKLPAELKGKFDCILVDPPFLSEDCQTKAALTVRWLMKASSEAGPAGRVMVCTGERMRELIEKRVYKPFGVKCTTLEVKHSQGLSNEFRCYSSFESDRIRWETS